METEIFREDEQDAKVIDQIAAALREELEQEIATLQARTNNPSQPKLGSVARISWRGFFNGSLASSDILTRAPQSLHFA